MDERRSIPLMHRPSMNNRWFDVATSDPYVVVNTSLDEAPMSASNHATSKAIVGAVGR